MIHDDALWIAGAQCSIYRVVHPEEFMEGKTKWMNAMHRRRHILSFEIDV